MLQLLLRLVLLQTVASGCAPMTEELRCYGNRYRGGES
jgi:hypothetical protein